MTNYLGSKSASGAYQAIIALMPPHDTYIETHLGSGAVILNKPAAQRNIAIDIDKTTIKNFKYNLCGYGSQIEIVNSDAHEYLENFSFTGNELIYSDPPYLHSTRTSNKRYRFEYGIDDHIKLLGILVSLPCNVILSGYPSGQYDKLLPDWNSKEFQVMTHGGVRTEKLWFNFEQDSAYWSSFAGKNFTDRQRIKRKALRWASNYSKLPANEQLAIMAALLQADAITE